MNWFLIVVICVVVPLVLLINLYLLVHYQHPEDRNQAWLPKLVVILGLTAAQLSVLLMPLDVANRAACDEQVVLSACNYTLNMKAMWYTVYIVMAVLVVAVIPFCLFYYEADSDYSFLGRVWSGLQWTLALLVVVALILGLGYGLAGFVDYPVRPLYSGLVPLSELSAVDEGGGDVPGESLPRCIPPGVQGDAGDDLCDATKTSAGEETWTLRTSFPVYVIAIASIAGWLLFMIFAGVGVVSLPVDSIKSFIFRPKKIITRSQYVAEATKVARRATELKEVASALRSEEKAGGKTRKWKKNVNNLAKELVLLEEDEAALAEQFPQGEDADTTWAFTVLGYFLKLLFGILAAVLSITWLVHVVLYVFIQPPVTPFLNDLFIKLDDAWALLGVAAFAVYCFYLVLCTIAGNFKLGMSIVVFTVHPMKVNGTTMSSFLFNVAIITLASIAVIQFCARAFDAYASETEIENIFGNHIEFLRGIKYLFVYNIFLYLFVGFAGLTLGYYALTRCGGSRSSRKRRRGEIEMT